MLTSHNKCADRLASAWMTSSPFHRVSSAFSTASAPRKGSVGGPVLLLTAVLCCAATVAYVHVSQRTAQEKMHQAVVMDKAKLRARRAAERKAADKLTSTQTTADRTPAQSGSA